MSTLNCDTDSYKSIIYDTITSVGIPKEIGFEEKRVALTPHSVERLVKNGLNVFIESNAGEAAGFRNIDYEIVGAKIVNSCQVWQNDLVVKVQPPTIDETSLLDSRTLISFLNPSRNNLIVEKLQSQKATVLGMDCVPKKLISGRPFDALYSQSVIAGYRAVIEAALEFGRLFSSFSSKSGQASTKVLIIGAGAAGLSAQRTAKSMGAIVSVYDERNYDRMKAQVEELGGIYYSNESNDSSQSNLLDDLIIQSDIVISTAIFTKQSDNKNELFIISKSIINKMKSGSVIVDMAVTSTDNIFLKLFNFGEKITKGSCEYSSHGKIVTTKNNVKIIGFSDLPSRLPNTASTMYSRNVENMILALLNKNEISYNIQNELYESIYDTTDSKYVKNSKVLNTIIHQSTIIHKGKLLWNNNNNNNESNDEIKQKINIKMISSSAHITHDKSLPVIEISDNIDNLFELNSTKYNNNDYNINNNNNIVPYEPSSLLGHQQRISAEIIRPSGGLFNNLKNQRQLTNILLSRRMINSFKINYINPNNNYYDNYNNYYDNYNDNDNKLFLQSNNNNDNNMNLNMANSKQDRGSVAALIDNSATRFSNAYKPSSATSNSNNNEISSKIENNTNNDEENNNISKRNNNSNKVFKRKKISIKNNDSQSSAKLPLPFMNINSIGITGRWKENSGNYILTPPQNNENEENIKPIGVIHFLGGAFVGAAPHITYRYLLEKLSEQGYIIVATPYRLDMDYLRICDNILSKFDSIAIQLASTYGPLPVIGLGHSCGSLLQILITSLFPDTPRAANILISFNNQPAASAIPAFNEVIVPLSEQIFKNNNENSKNIREISSILRVYFDRMISRYANSSLAPLFVSNEILPFVSQSLEIIDQLPPLLETIAEGEVEFKPNPIETKEVCRRMYRARSTLLIKFENDDIDESVEIEKVLREANTIMRMKRPMVEMEVELKIMTGTHLTPLTQNLELDLSAILDQSTPSVINDLEVSLFKSEFISNFMKTVNDVTDEISSFLDVNINRSIK
eukprot:gene10080-13546_t